MAGQYGAPEAFGQHGPQDRTTGGTCGVPVAPALDAGDLRHMSTRSAGFLVRGRVQGVGFRWWTARQARQLGLGGTVRNLPDGSVEVFARGEADALEELRRRLAVGPGAAIVGAVDPADPPVDLPDRFEIVG